MSFSQTAKRDVRVIEFLLGKLVCDSEKRSAIFRLRKIVEISFSYYREFFHHFCIISKDREMMCKKGLIIIFPITLHTLHCAVM